MPENIDGLLADFGISSDTNAQDNATDNTAVGNATDTAANTADPAETPTDSAPTDSDVDAAQAAAQLEEQKRNQAFANMRAENSKYKKFMQTLMKGSNFTGDEAAFITALENEAYKKQAQIQGMAANPELLRKMDQQEEQIKALTKSQQDQTLMLGLKTLQQTNNLSGKEVEEFVQRAIDNKIDLLAPGVNFDTLYKGMFFEDIMKKQIEAERQNWIKQSSKADHAANPDGSSGKKESSPTDVKTMAEFNSLLNSVSKEIR